MEKWRTLKRQAEQLMALRKDAYERGMLGLAIVYGWSAMQRYLETLAEQRRELI